MDDENGGPLRTVSLFFCHIERPHPAGEMKEQAAGETGSFNWTIASLLCRGSALKSSSAMSPPLLDYLAANIRFA
jgi:hypothetical protein